MSPWYRTAGKILTPITDEVFIDRMRGGVFVEEKHKGFIALLYYSAVRKHEALRSIKENFKLDKDFIIFDVGKRLKHGIVTSPLNIPIAAPFADNIWASVEDTRKGKRVWPYSDKTGYNIVHRVFPYPHLFRLSRITNFFLDGWTVAQVHSWTGLTIAALNYYVGLVDVRKMGESLKKVSSR